MEYYREDGARNFSEMHSKRTRSNFASWEILVANHEQTLYDVCVQALGEVPREAVESPFLGDTQNWTGKALSRL